MADGSIIIDTRIDTGGVSKGMNAVKAGMARISAQVSKMGDSAKSSFQRQITAITGLYQNYEKQERKVSELKSKLEELSKVRIETEEYKKLKDDIKALEDEFEKVETKQREWLDMGFSIDSAPLQELDKQMDDIWADIDRLQRKQKEMQTTGRAYVDPTSTDAYKSTAEKCNVESQKLEHINGRLYSSYNKLKNKVEEYRQKNSRLVQVMQNLQKAAARVGMVVKNMGSALRRAGSAIKSMVSAMKKAVENMFNLNKQTDRSRMSLSRMLGMSLLFSGVSRAISAVSDGVKSGFENLAQYSNSTNSAISSLMSSMTRLKNSFATAFAPVLTVVAPIMSRFIDMISRAITYVGMFVAALTGQNSFVKAVGVQEDYAAGLEKTSKNTNQAAKNTKKANKETEGYLSTLDEIQRYTSNKNDDSVADGNSIGDTGGYTAPTPAQMFKKVPVANSIKGIADKIKKLIKSEDWEGLGKYIAMVQKLGEYGVSAEKATQILEQYGAQAGVSSAFVEEMTGKVQALGKGFSESSSTIDTSSITVKESIKGIRSVLYDLSVSSSEYAGTYRGVLEVFNNTSGSAANAQDAFNIVYNALKEAGVPLDELNKKLAQEFPSAAQATKSSVDSSIVEAQKTVSSSTGKMKTDAETNLAGVKKAAEDASGGVNTTTVTNWGNSASEVKKNLDKMKQTANLKLGEMQKTVESHFSGQYNTMTKKWEKACERIGQLITQMVRSTKDSLNGFTRNMNTIGNEMSNNLINGISGAVTGIAGILNEVVSKVNSTISNVNSSLSGIEKAFTFSYDVTTPDGKRRWGKYSMNLPRVNTVPYLAKGAVIPPRSEFLAVLGDQKQGNNIETPEALLRKIVREETAGRQAGGGSYRFTAQINRRTLFDEMMKEAQMRRDTSGRNPFEMA